MTGIAALQVVKRDIDPVVILINHTGEAMRGIEAMNAVEEKVVLEVMKETGGLKLIRGDLTEEVNTIQAEKQISGTVIQSIATDEGR